MADEYVLKHDNPWQGGKGVWRGGIFDGVSTATVSCPKCGEVASLTAHRINSEGKVTPSLTCPARNCDFHEWVRLDGWNKKES